MQLFPFAGTIAQIECLGEIFIGPLAPARLFIQTRRTAETRSSGNAYLASVLPNAVLVGRQIDAVDLVLGHVTVKPLNLRPHLFQRLQGTQGYVPDLGF